MEDERLEDVPRDRFGNLTRPPKRGTELVIDRAFEIFRAWHKQPGAREDVYWGTTPSWRVSIDVRRAILVEMVGLVWVSFQLDVEERLLGWPLDVDGSLPPGSIVLVDHPRSRATVVPTSG